MNYKEHITQFDSIINMAEAATDESEMQKAMILAICQNGILVAELYGEKMKAAVTNAT